MKRIKKSTSKDYQKGYRDRLNKIPLEESQTEDYKRGWWDANRRLQLVD